MLNLDFLQCPKTSKSLFLWPNKEINDIFERVSKADVFQMRKSNKSSEIVKYFIKQNDFGITDLKKICNKEWLNDMVIECYLEMLIKRRENFKLFGNCFYDYQHDKIKYNRSNFFEKTPTVEIVFIPIYLRNHWVLGVAVKKEKKILFYDSLGDGRPKEYMRTITNHLNSGKEKGWSFKVVPKSECPQQTNGFDCGVFILKIAESIVKGTPLKYVHQKYMQYYRAKMILEFEEEAKVHAIAERTINLD